MINKDELIFVVDENNQPIKPKPRQKVHQNGYWHRTSHIWISNHKGQILCQQRSLLKDSSPGKWESFFGGHLPPDKEYLEGAIDELNEELELGAQENDLHFIFVYKNERSKEFQAVFYLDWDGDITTIKFEAEEIDQLKWVGLKELKNILLVQHDPHWSLMGYEEQVFEYITNNRD